VMRTLIQLDQTSFNRRQAAIGCRLTDGANSADTPPIIGLPLSSTERC